MDWQDRIITLFVQICDSYKNGLWTYCQRFTNYANLTFTDEEVITIYMYGTMEGLTTGTIYSVLFLTKSLLD